MALGYLEARRETGASPGKESGVSASFAAKTVYVPALEFEWDPVTSMLLRDDELRNVNEPLLHVVETFDPTWKLSMRLMPDTIAFFFNAIAPVTTTAGDGIITDLGGGVIPIGATRHRWAAPHTSGTSAPRTMMFRGAYTEEGVYYDARGCTIDTVDISVPDNGGARLELTGKALYVSSIADPALTPAYEALSVAPFMRASATLAWLASSAVTETIDLKFESQTEFTHTFGGASKYPDLAEYADGVPVWSGSIEKRRLATADYAGLIAATRFTALIGYINQSIIASGYPYKIYLQGSTSAAYAGGSPHSLVNSRRIGATYDFRLSRDAAVSSTFEVVNATASLA